MSVDLRRAFEAQNRAAEVAESGALAPFVESLRAMIASRLAEIAALRAMLSAVGEAPDAPRSAPPPAAVAGFYGPPPSSGA